jgi:hypothetical protein
MKQFILFLSLAVCSAQEFAPLTTPFPSNRKQPALDPALDLVKGVLIPPQTIPTRPIPPNRKQPALPKADIVMAATDKVGILVNNLARDLAVDLNALINSLPASSNRGTRAMVGQFAVRDQDYPDEEE